MKRVISFILITVLLLSLVACGTPVEDTSTDKGVAGEGIAFDAGKYQGKAMGHNGSLEVEVEFSEDAILAINIINSEETEHLSKSVYEMIPTQIIEEQSLNVDTVTGATVTSIALKNAVIDAVVKANGDVDLLKKDIIKDEPTEVVELETDVIVIGGGGAGLSAALSAEENGLSVILLEKNVMLGGHTALSGGYTTVTGSKLQERLGVTDDTPEKAYKDIMINGGNKSVPELLKLYTENMGEATDWTIDYVGAKPADELRSYSENSADRVLIYDGNGEGLINAFTDKLAASSVDTYLDTKATALITEGDEVVGVEAEAKDGTKYRISAQSTVIATGGYGAMRDLLPERLKKLLYYGAALSSGDGITMGQDIGADVVNMGYAEIYQDGVEWKPGIAKSTVYGTMAAWYESGIFVDRKGERVVNELGTGAEIVEQQEAQADGRLFLFMDQDTFTSFNENIFGTGISQEMIDGWLESNGSEDPIFASGSTVEEVAETVGVDVDGLKATIERFNSFVEKGVDEDFGRPATALKREIADGPYYLVEQKPRYATTLGGLLTNNSLQVINTDGSIIKGLYSAGDAAGGVRGDTSIPGADIGWAITSGYLIGQILSK